MRHIEIGVLVTGLALSSMGCSDSQPSFKSVSDTSEAKNSDANGEAVRNFGEDGFEDSNASQLEPTTVIVGDSTEANEPQNSSVMTISIGEDTGGETLDDESSPTDTSYNSNSNAATGSDGTNGTGHESTGPDGQMPGETAGESKGTGDPAAGGDSNSSDAGASGSESITDTTNSTNPSTTLNPDEVPESVIFECTGRKDVSTKNIKVVSSKNSGPITVHADQYLFIHATGNRPLVKLNTENAENTKIRGICIFASGNQARIEANIGINIDSFSYFGTGNKSSGSVRVSESVAIGALKVKLRGHQAKLTISGPSSYDCGNANLGGKQPNFVCAN